MAVGAGVSTLAAVLAIALLVRSAGWPISFPQFMAYAGAGMLAVVAALFAFWTWACAGMRYYLDRAGLTIHWGPIRHFVSIDRIEALSAGRGEHRPRISGLSWWGYHVGRGYVEGLGRVLFFSTHRSPEDLVYVRTPDATYALSPQDPGRFIAEARRFQSAGKPSRPSGVERHPLSAHPLWSDGIAQTLALAAVLINVALWGYLFAVYPDLNNQITIEFPPLGDIATLHARSEILKIPATATAMLVVNLLAGLAFQRKERAATYLLLSGTIFFQTLFVVAAVIAVINA